MLGSALFFLEDVLDDIADEFNRYDFYFFNSFFLSGVADYFGRLVFDATPSSRLRCLTLGDFDFFLNFSCEVSLVESYWSCSSDLF
jgi:hypothetical protein